MPTHKRNLDTFEWKKGVGNTSSQFVLKVSCDIFGLCESSMKLIWDLKIKIKLNAGFAFFKQLETRPVMMLVAWSSSLGKRKRLCFGQAHLKRSKVGVLESSNKNVNVLRCTVWVRSLTLQEKFYLLVYNTSKSVIDALTHLKQKECFAKVSQAN